MNTMARGTLTAVRITVGAAFLFFGLPKLGAPPEVVANFTHWGLPFPGALVPAVGLLEVVAGALLVLGLATRGAAAALAVNMLGAVLTAGRVDGGFHLQVPPVLLALAVLLALRGGGAWQLQALARSRRPRTS